MSDREIIEGFLKGDPRIYEIVREWICIVLRSARYGSSLSEEDIAADTIAKLLTNLRENNFRFDSALKTYVQRITRYTLIDALRSSRFTKTNQALVEETVDPSDQLAEFEDREEQELFALIMEKMDRKCTNLWRMIFHEELPYRKIAEKLNITEGAVKTRVLRCKEKAMELGKKMR